MILIHDRILAAVTIPEPVDQPLLAFISLSAFDARTSAMIAVTTGQITHETIARIKAISALSFVFGAAAGGGGGWYAPGAGAWYPPAGGGGGVCGPPVTPSALGTAACGVTGGTGGGGGVLGCCGGCGGTCPA